MVQQTFESNNSGNMQQPPEMISSKDLLYLSDMMSWNLGVIKKANFLAQDCKLPEIKQAAEQVYQMHERHYQLLLNYAKNNSNQMVH
ncbi:hypothetical protein SAMN04488134_11171 [Amphibacillus marinus]|uniref:Coat F domain-containing protein n=1 Tax=Amphibacillus marinus TaxID=872970 RepID=A0A1H8RXC6_9BACI|nr:spore coat protein [Amphibacillus marinus]SEO70946.1 hypothetical protein SAMN04488134_11171 [Amphibacillus marinus]